MENVHTYQMDGDYAPVLVIYKDKVLLKGDNTHESHFEAYAEGYADALDVKINSHWIETTADLEKHEKVLTQVEMYEEFQRHLTSFY